MKVAIRSIDIRLRASTTAATGVEQFGRFFLCWDRQANATAPAAITDVILTNAVTSPRNLAARRRFKIILDKTYAMGATATSTGTQTSRVFKYYLKLRRPVQVEFNTANNGTIADIVSNSLYIMTTGNIAAGDTDHSLIGNIRIRYTDM